MKEIYQHQRRLPRRWLLRRVPKDSRHIQESWNVTSRQAFPHGPVPATHKPPSDANRASRKATTGHGRVDDGRQSNRLHTPKATTYPCMKVPHGPSVQCMAWSSYCFHFLRRLKSSTPQWKRAVSSHDSRSADKFASFRRQFEGRVRAVRRSRDGRCSFT